MKLIQAHHWVQVSPLPYQYISIIFLILPQGCGKADEFEQGGEQGPQLLTRCTG